MAYSVCVQDVYVFPDSCGPPSNWKSGLRGESRGAVTCSPVKASPALAHHHF